VVPERVGAITPAQIAAEAADWLANPERLAGMKADLQSLRGRPGAVAALAEQVELLLPNLAEAPTTAPTTAPTAPSLGRQLDL
jgi:hypothetical protein